MTCADARTLLLTADPAELRGSTGSDLALHIATCAACRAEATLLLDAQAELERALAAPAMQGAARAVGDVLSAAHRRRADARRRAWTIPIAAAAVIAGVVVVRSIHAPIDSSRPASPPNPSHGVTVAAPPGRSVAVLQTDNPNVVVIWFF